MLVQGGIDYGYSGYIRVRGGIGVELGLGVVG